MSIGLRLFVVPLLIAGCASQLLQVPEKDLNVVPAAQRAELDKTTDAAMVSARTELTAADTALAEAKGAPIEPAVQGGRTKVANAPIEEVDDEDWAKSLRDHNQQRSGAVSRVETAKVAWLRARLTWAEHRRAAAAARIDVAVCERELLRAQAIDRNLLGSDTYEMAPLRGQLSRAQQRWHVEAVKAREARVAFQRASTDLASAKEAYAQLVRNGPAGAEMSTVVLVDDPDMPRLELKTWTVQRSDIRRRRGLRRYLDETPKAVALRGVALRPSIAIRTPTTVLPASAKPERAVPQAPVKRGQPSAAMPVSREPEMVMASAEELPTIVVELPPQKPISPADLAEPTFVVAKPKAKKQAAPAAAPIMPAAAATANSAAMPAATAPPVAKPAVAPAEAAAPAKPAAASPAAIAPAKPATPAVIAAPIGKPGNAPSATAAAKPVERPW